MTNSAPPNICRFASSAVYLSFTSSCIILSFVLLVAEPKYIDNILSNIKNYENSKLYRISNDEFYVKYDPDYNIPNNSIVNISGLTSSFSNLNKKHIVSVPEFNTKLINNITYGNLGIVTDIQVQDLPRDIFPSKVSIGSSIQIFGESYDQYFEILNYFKDLNVLRVKRVSSAGLSTADSLVKFLPNILIVIKKIWITC